MIEWLRRLIAPAWVIRNPFNMLDYDRESDGLPTIEGFYRVKVSGDSESVDGHLIYEYEDYETWAYFTPDNDDSGVFAGDHDEDNYNIFAWCGPFHVRPYG